MTTIEENELITRVGPGTPCGELLRRYWQPVCAASELTAEKPKTRVQMLGEDLVVFRDRHGGYGLLGEHCSHRGTSLYYGFLEEGGIRCPYHGWLYDASGKCVEQPFEPAQSMMRHTIRHPAYPVEELGGILFAYMGPPEKKPLLPRWDVLVWEDGKRTIRLQETLNCNWLQAQENSADVTHTYYLHAHMLKLQGLKGGEYYARPFEEFGFQPFEFGLIKTWKYAPYGRFGAEEGGGNPLIFPNVLRQQSGAWHNLHYRVPIDDTHTRIFVINFTRNADGHPEPQPEHPPVEFTTETTPDGEYILDSFFAQDKMAWETQGARWDRTQEHIGASDRGIVLVRKMLLEQIDIIREGGDPLGLIRDPERNRVIELPGWFIKNADGMGEAQGATPRNLVPSEGLLDDRLEVFRVASGAARTG